MKDYCKDMKTTLTPDREKLVKDMTNYLCEVQKSAQDIVVNGVAIVTLLIDGILYKGRKVIHQLNESNRQICITPDKSVSKIMELVQEALPRRYRHRWFVLAPVGMKIKPAEFLG